MTDLKTCVTFENRSHCTEISLVDSSKLRKDNFVNLTPLDGLNFFSTEIFERFFDVNRSLSTFKFQNFLNRLLKIFSESETSNLLSSLNLLQKIPVFPRGKLNVLKNSFLGHAENSLLSKGNLWATFSYLIFYQAHNAPTVADTGYSVCDNHIYSIFQG